MKRGQQRERKAAVALGYAPGRDPAPRVIAAGQGELAEALLRAAREHGVPIETDQPLAGALVKLEPGDLVPPELYAAVAQVLAMLWRLEDEQSAKEGSRP